MGKLTIGNVCTRGPLQIRGLIGDKVIPEAWHHGAWAVSRQPDEPTLFQIVLKPAGLSLPHVWASFRTVEAAVSAMVAIARLRNDWYVIGQRDLSLRLAGHMRDICTRCGAIHGRQQVSVSMDKSILGLPTPRRLNGMPARAPS